MKRSTDPLLRELFAESGVAREPLLDRSLASYRKGRLRRRATRAAIALPLMLALAWLAFPIRVGAPRPEAAIRLPPPPVPEKCVPGTSVRIIGDEELLRLLQGQPVALLTTPRGKQVILFDQTGPGQ